MKKLLMLIICVIFGCLTILAQETATFLILKIKEIKNDCYVLTARNNNKEYTIYSHFDDKVKCGEKIKLREELELKIIPFFRTEKKSMAEFKKSMGFDANTEDSIAIGEVTLPLNYKEIDVDYHGNIFRIKKKKLYYTSDINGVCKIQK